MHTIHHVHNIWIQDASCTITERSTWNEKNVWIFRYSNQKDFELILFM